MHKTNTRSLFNLNKDQISIIKSIGILMIVLHNFLHWRSGIGENEMTFSYGPFNNLIRTISNDPTSIFSGLFTFFGHYGVQLFIFVSAYGLTKKFLTKNQSINYIEYISFRILKIYSLLIIGLLVNASYEIFYFGTNTASFMKTALKTLSLTNNFHYDSVFAYVGPWWFFSLIVQLYFIFPFLYKYLQKRKEMGFILLLSLTYLLIFVLLPFTEDLKIPMFGNFLGHMPEFLLGIALAMFPNLTLKFKHLLFALCLFVISNLSKHTFPFSFLSITVVMLVIIRPLLFVRKSFIIKSLIFIGGISMFLFLINGQLRTFTLNKFVPSPIISSMHTYMWAVIHTVIAIAISYILSIIYNKTLMPLTNKLHRLLFVRSKNEEDSISIK